MSKKPHRILQVAVVVGVLGIAPGMLRGQCPQQTCRLVNGQFYDCQGSTGSTGCSVKVGDASQCTDWVCQDGDGIVPDSGGSSRLNSPLPALAANAYTYHCKGASSLTMTPVSQKVAGTTNTSVRLARGQLRGPASLLDGTFGTKDLFLGGTLINLSRRTIVAYRLGWMVAYPHRRPETVLGAWMNIPAGITPKRTHDVPAQNVSPTPLKNGANEIIFYVAELRYADGSSWKENVHKILRPARTNDGTTIDPLRRDAASAQLD